MGIMLYDAILYIYICILLTVRGVNRTAPMGSHEVKAGQSMSVQPGAAHLPKVGLGPSSCRIAG